MSYPPSWIENREKADASQKAQRREFSVELLDDQIMWWRKPFEG